MARARLRRFEFVQGRTVSSKAIRVCLGQIGFVWRELRRFAAKRGHLARFALVCGATRPSTAKRARLRQDRLVHDRTRPFRTKRLGRPKIGFVSRWTNSSGLRLTLQMAGDPAPAEPVWEVTKWS
jgi:hypothetical protein